MENTNENQATNNPVPTPPILTSSNKWYKHKGLITVMALIVIVAGVSYLAINKKDQTGCLAVVYGEYQNPKTGEIKMFEGCTGKPPADWVSVVKDDTKQPQIETKTSVNGLVYAKYTDTGTGLWSPPDIILLDSQSGSTSTINSLANNESIDGYALTHGYSKTLNHLKGSSYFYYIKDTPNVGSILVKADLTGKVLQEVPVSEGLLSIAISKNGDKVAWCTTREAGPAKPQYVTVYDFNNKTKIEISDPDACGLGSGRMTFSQDGNKLYYFRGFWELYGDYTDEEFEKLSKENKNGLHVIDLQTKQFSMLEPNYQGNKEFTFWNDPSIDFKNRLIGSLSTQSDKLTLKKLPAQSFDYLTEDQIDKLESVDVVQTPNKFFLDWLMTEDGQGIFYNLSNDRNFSSNQIGYYELATKQNYFPLPNVQGFASSVTFFAALDKDHLYYMGGISHGSDPSILYETDFQGRYKIIDGGRNVQKIGPVKK